MQERIRQQKTSHTESSAPVDTDAAQSADVAEKIKSDIDDLLDEIDEVLESNAEEFVKNYVQKGGQ